MSQAKEFKEKKRESTVKICNRNLLELKEDILYHLALSTDTHDLAAMFGDVKFVCMGGTPQRMETFAYYLTNELGLKLPLGLKLEDLGAKSHRFALYKVGPILSVSHGMGMPSVSILLHEMIKLVHYAKCHDPIFIRIGTSGGIGLEPGTVVVSEEGRNCFLKACHEFVVLGKKVERPSIFSKEVSNDLLKCSESTDDFKVVIGKTLATDDFYEGQGRTDGAICEYTEEEKFEFLKKAHALGVRNIEMEATVVAALTKYTGIKAADVCVTLLNRLNGDQVTTPKDQLLDWQMRPQKIVGRYIKKTLLEMGLLPQTL